MGLRKPLFVVLGAVLACSVMLVSGQQPSDRGTVHRRAGECRPHGVPGELCRLSRRRSHGIPAARGRRLHGRLVHAQHAGSLRADPDDDADGQTGRALRGHLREHHRVHPAVERHDAWHAPLTATTSVVIGAPASAPAAAPPAQAAQAPAPAPAGRGAGAAGAAPGGGRGQPQAPVVGLTVAGEVKDFARVTDEMLKNPPPG